MPPPQKREKVNTSPLLIYQHLRPKIKGCIAVFWVINSSKHIVFSLIPVNTKGYWKGSLPVSSLVRIPDLGVVTTFFSDDFANEFTLQPLYI